MTTNHIYRLGGIPDRPVEYADGDAFCSSRHPEFIQAMNFDLRRLEIVLDLDMTLIHSINPHTGNNRKAMEEELERLKRE